MISPPTSHFTYRVYWEDTDAGGVVYHARYLHFYERARTDWLLALGFPQVEFRAKTQCVFVVTRIETDFIKPARLEDELLVSVCVEDMKKASMVFDQTILRASDNALLNRAKVTVASVHADTFKPARLPAQLRAAFQHS